jgi:AbrB family looped-hinge helix DNA binding protein
LVAKLSIRVDAKGRLTIPEDVRKRLGIDPGECFFLDAEDGVLRFTRAESPFDLLAQHAIAEYRAGRTRSLQEVAADLGFSLED